MIDENDRIFKLLLRCLRDRHKPDLHTFWINLNNGKAYVEAQEQGIYIERHTVDGKIFKFVGTAIAAANYLDKYGADYSTYDM